MNGNGLKLAISLVVVLASINVALTGWALTNIVKIRESQATTIQRVKSIEDTRFSDLDGEKLKSEFHEDVVTHTH